MGSHGCLADPDIFQGGTGDALIVHSGSAADVRAPPIGFGVQGLRKMQSHLHLHLKNKRLLSMLYKMLFSLTTSKLLLQDI